MAACIPLIFLVCTLTFTELRIVQFGDFRALSLITLSVLGLVLGVQYSLLLVLQKVGLNCAKRCPSKNQAVNINNTEACDS